jgi:hypothetical protein
VEDKPRETRENSLFDTSAPHAAAVGTELRVPVSPAAERFQSCRWRKPHEDGTADCCGHRDVLPMTGANGFDATAWCPDCGYYKLRRTPKKRDDYGFQY